MTDYITNSEHDENKEAASADNKTHGRTLVEVLREVLSREEDPRIRYYLWISGFLVPFDEIMKEREDVMCYSDLPVWDWRGEENTTFGVHHSLDFEAEVMYARHGCVFNPLYCYDIFSEYPTEYANPKYACVKRAVLRVDNARSSRPVPDCDPPGPDRDDTESPV